MLRFNENNEVLREDQYKAILVGLQKNEDIAYSMEELEGLAEAVGTTVLGHMIQNLERPNTATQEKLLETVEITAGDRNG